VRAALISLAAQPREAAAGAPLTIAGKTLAQRQLEFALAAGCERIVVLGEGASRDAIALSHKAEAAGAQFQAISGSHGLLGTARSGDELLVLGADLLPEAPEALTALAGSPAVLVLPGAAGAAAGFERIDLQRAWAGAFVIPGALVEKLAELPADAEAAPSLLRIALQANVKERVLDSAVLAAGNWTIVSPGGTPAAERAWFERNLPRATPLAPTELAALAAVNAMRVQALRQTRLVPLLTAAFVVLLVAAALSSWLGWPVVGFVLLTIGVMTGSVASLLARLKAAPLGRAPDARWNRISGVLIDLGLAACAAFAVAGDTLHKAFPPLVLVAALRASTLARRSDALALLADRGVLAAILALAAAFGLVEPAAMFLALAVIALEATKPPATLG
jgi:hypothetical protein